MKTTILVALVFLALILMPTPAKSDGPAPPPPIGPPAVIPPLLAGVELAQPGQFESFLARAGPINSLHVVRANTVIPGMAPQYWALLVDCVELPDTVWLFDYGSANINLQLTE